MRRLPLGVWLLVGVTVGASTFVFYMSDKLSQPSVGTIRQTQPVQQLSGANEYANVQNVGNFAKFQTRSDFQKRRPDTVATPVIERFSFIRPNAPMWTLSITISKLPSNNLDEEGSYNFRNRNANYVKSSFMAEDGKSYPIMSNTVTGMYDKTAFILYDGHVAAISMSSTSDMDKDELDIALEDVLKTWQWRIHS